MNSLMPLVNEKERREWSLRTPIALKAYLFDPSAIHYAACKAAGSLLLTRLSCKDFNPEANGALFPTCERIYLTGPSQCNSRCTGCTDFLCTLYYCVMPFN